MRKLIVFSTLCVAMILLPLSAKADVITTLFSGGNGGSSLWTNYFDITVKNAGGINITDYEVNINSAGTGTGFTIDVYTTAAGDTYVGNTDVPGAWSLVSSGAGVGAGENTPTAVDTADFFLGPGTYGMAIRYLGVGMRYTNGDGSNQTYEDTNVRLDLGASRATTDGPFTGGTLFSPRVWNGSIAYQAVPEPAGGILVLGLATMLVGKRWRRS